MPGHITRFCIEGLHNHRTIDIPIVDNKIVLVGENGTGKSTVVNLLYFFLTRQWERMLRYTFRSISLTIDSEEIYLDQEQFKVSSLFFDRAFNKIPLPIPPPVIRRMLKDFSFEEFIERREEIAHRLSLETGMSHTRIRKMLSQWGEEILSSTEGFEVLQEYMQTLNAAMTDKVLYLPTYRRIEQDLSSIFPRIDPEHVTRRKDPPGCIEMIGFGMQDVEEAIQRKMNSLSENLRNGLNKLTGTYLRDIIRGDYKSADPSGLRKLDSTTIDDIFSRIEPSIIPQPEQENLKQSLNNIRSGALQEDKVVIHFLTQLIKLYTEQRKDEQDVENFVKVCNQYLLNKRMVYDKADFTITIQHHENGSDNSIEQPSEHGKEISMQELSSGEKQIISLFSHIYLSGNAGYFVIIDEPELSLSVTWQERFLTDILDTGRCNGLVAATHSPFVINNKLDAYAHSIEEFTRLFDERDEVGHAEAQA